VASLCAVTVLLFVAWLGLRPLLNITVNFSTDELQRLDTLGRLQLLSFAEVETPEDHAQKFIGRVRNNSSKLVTGITAAVGFYDDTKTLKDLFTERLKDVSLLKPGQEADFEIVRPDDRGHSGAKPIKTTTPHTELRFVDVMISRESRQGFARFDRRTAYGFEDLQDSLVLAR
jgi:hypothetical protein